MRILDITDAFLNVGCSLGLIMMNIQTVPERLGANRQLTDVDVSGVFPTTSLQYGFTTEEPGYFGAKYLEYARTLPPTAKMLEVGPGWLGVTTLPVLANGQTVYAVDRMESELQTLAWRAMNESESKTWKGKLSNWRKNLIPIEGAVPDRLPLEDNSIDAVNSGSVLHFLTGEQLIQALLEFRRVLKPGGKLFIETQTPYMEFLRTWQQNRAAELKEMKSAGMELPRWPWIIDNREGQFPILGKVEYVNLLDRELLFQMFRDTDFQFDDAEVGYFARAEYPEKKSWHAHVPAVREQHVRDLSYGLLKFESVGGIAVKPLVSVEGNAP